MAYRYVNGILEEYPDPPPPSAEEIRAGKLQQLPMVRYEHETKGITVGGVQIRTDPESQAKINGAYTPLKFGLRTEVEWKGANGWVTVGLAQLEPLALAVFDHVEACYAHERALEAALALDENTDISAGWPG